jgi:hypothetical protein
MNQQDQHAGDTNMMNAERISNHVNGKGTLLALSAGSLIALGLALQWIEVLFTRLVSQNSWFFTTLFGEAWNMISVWLSAASWQQDMQYWPLLLVITGATILFSRIPRRAAVVGNESRTGARPNA